MANNKCKLCNSNLIKGKFSANNFLHFDCPNFTTKPHYYCYVYLNDKIAVEGITISVNNYEYIIQFNYADNITNIHRNNDYKRFNFILKLDQFDDEYIMNRINKIFLLK